MWSKGINVYLEQDTTEYDKINSISMHYETGSIMNIQWTFIELNEFYVNQSIKI